MTDYEIIDLSLGRQIAYDEAGSGDPVLLVHGMTEDRRAWDELTPALVKRFRVIRIDLPSHGRSSDLPGVDPAGIAAIVTEFLQRLRVTKPHVIGHSLGGLVASLLAASGRTSSVINVDMPFFVGQWIDTARRLEARLRGADFSAALVEWMDELAGPNLPPSVREELCRGRANTHQHVPLTMFGPSFDRTATEQSIAETFRPLLAHIRCPYLALLGSDPGSGYSSWLSGHMPSARVEIWDGLGHWLHRVEPERFARRVLEFLRDALANQSAV